MKRREYLNLVEGPVKVRNRKIVEDWILRRENRMSLRKLGHKYSISHERVRQIIERGV